MARIKERGSTHIYKVNRISPEEINGMTNICVAEQPPYCNAACPLRVDVRSMMEAAAKGNFKKALAVYEKVSPFPILLSTHCEAPCEKKCKMCELGDGIAIRDIEKAIVTYGERTISGGVFRTKKKKTVAIFGDDLFTLFLAGEMEKKMYPVTVFTQKEDLDTYLSNLNATEERTRIEGMEIDFEFSKSISSELFESFDVICGSEDSVREIFPEAVCNDNLMVYEKEKIVMGRKAGVLQSAADAKKAALSVDRLAQNLDPNNSRGDEGAVETNLYTNTEGVTAVRRVEVIDRDTAVEEAKRCLLCHCDECMKACAFLQHFEKKPGLIGREIYNNTQIIMGTHPLNHAMNACTLCGQCKEVCPNGIDMATICQHARANMVTTDKMPLSQHEFALLDMLFSNEEAFLCRKQPEHETCKYVFFPGCQAGAIAPNTVKSAYEDLCKRLDGGVAIMLGCCSVMAKWSGRDELYCQQKEFISSQLKELGNPQIIAGCPMCKKELSTYNNVVGIWEILNEIGLPNSTVKIEKTFAIHDSCGARGDVETQSAVKKLVEKLGITVADIEYSGDKSPCCGYGGLTAYADPPVAREITQKAIDRTDAPFVTYCMACRDRFSKQGHESYHVLEMIYGTSASESPNLSEKRFNRLSLKANILKEIWNEDFSLTGHDFEIEYTDEALQLMEERFILKSDVEQVIEHVRKSGEYIFDEESKLNIACFRPGNVTFWVKYDEKDSKYTIHRAWSHRMFIQNRE